MLRLRGEIPKGEHLFYNIKILFMTQEQLYQKHQNVKRIQYDGLKIGVNEEKRLRIMDRMYNQMINQFYIMAYDIPALKGLIQQTKPNKEDGTQSEYKYYVSSCVVQLVQLLKHLNVNTLVDLGCGAGILCKALNMEGIITGGYDIEEPLIKIAKRFNDDEYFRFAIKDITKLKQKDIVPYKAIYFWEPILSRDLCKTFINNLVSIVTPDQYIICRPSGSSLTHLIEHERTHYYMEYWNLHVFKLKEK